MTQAFSNIDVARIPETELETAYDYPCPLCDCAARTTDDLYSHLVVSHRKSRLARALLDRVPRATEENQPSASGPLTSPR